MYFRFTWWFLAPAPCCRFVVVAPLSCLVTPAQVSCCLFPLFWFEMCSGCIAAARPRNHLALTEPPSLPTLPLKPFALFASPSFCRCTTDPQRSCLNVCTSSAPSQFDDLDSALVASVDHMEQSNLSSLEAASRDSELVVLQVMELGLIRLAVESFFVFVCQVFLSVSRKYLWH